jgi:hypothetical protein
MKITVFIGDESHLWNSHHEPYTVREDQDVYFELTPLENNTDTPKLFLEDTELYLSTDYRNPLARTFRSSPSYIFREAFGLSTISVYLGEHHFELRFEVLVKKANAQYVEEMIHYLTQKQEDILRICFSRTLLKNGTTEHGETEPETLLNTVETFVETLISCRLELQHHLHKRLIPVRQPAWKSSNASDIDPFDILFNLDALEPVFGDGDVIVNGRSFSISEMEVTTLEPTANVEENAILLGGLYSMRRIITRLLQNLSSDSSPHKQKTPDVDDYETLDNVLLRLTSSNSQQRCEDQLFQLEEFIRHFEQKIGLIYKGERPPIMTPIVRASRVYRRLFEQLHEWYKLGEPALNGRNYLVKLRSVSKIYEFVVLFKLIDFLHENNWIIVESKWMADLKFVPSLVSFERNGLKLTLNYETKIYPFSGETKHFDLVDTKHSNASWDYNYWSPDFVLRLDNVERTKAVYLILDAKYSSSGTVERTHLPTLVEKYFMNMAVYDANNQTLKQDAILGIIALFSDKDKNSSSPIYLSNGRKFGIDKKPVRFPIVTGVSVLVQSTWLTYQVFNRIFELAEKQLTTHL